MTNIRYVQKYGGKRRVHKRIPHVHIFVYINVPKYKKKKETKEEINKMTELKEAFANKMTNHFRCKYLLFVILRQMSESENRWTQHSGERKTHYKINCSTQYYINFVNLYCTSKKRVI